MKVFSDFLHEAPKLSKATRGLDRIGHRSGFDGSIQDRAIKNRLEQFLVGQVRTCKVGTGQVKLGQVKSSCNWLSQTGQFRKFSGPTFF